MLLVDFIFQDKENNFFKESLKYKYCLADKNVSKANEEYIRSHLYFVINKSLELKDQNQKDEAKSLLNEMKEWLNKNNKRINKNQYNRFLSDIEEALKGYDNNNELDYAKYEANMNRLVLGNMKKNAYDFDIDNDICNQNLNCNEEYYARKCNMMLNDEKF